MVASLAVVTPAHARPAGTGTGAWNRNPVTIETSQSGTTYLMRDPRWPGLDCVDAVTGTVFSGPDDVWGNGNPTDRETGCVDAYYAAQTFQRMTVRWLGRNGADGNGRPGLGLKVGEPRQGLGTTGGRIWVGYNSAGQWVGSLDLVGREYGLLIDRTTPGGPSGNGTGEFVADAFGAATEWFSGQTTADLLIGERPSTNPRNMSNPAASGGINCYSSAVPTAEPYSAAGVGDHWFALLAAGSRPDNGLPASPTCDGSTIRGIGVDRAIKILYGAMLRKVSGMTYQKYRILTLRLALDLTPGNCSDYKAVKAAWNAVSVPAQPGEPSVVCD
ncbi:M4 family metallopeptidase [Actinokineospora terrae]|uniref:Thermolysin metallopeptidase, catalytic domain n=1 Tax=Actinokineospora terrae TaxID=155974 RepID=A0A1H9X6L7_9PSEU|nr:M4 family metallopeptidase [Actinokineospora terrae]SES41517.1 Thermolysin metallopeptidase, catalytic domain [Actinokineospora terrae]